MVLPESAIKIYYYLLFNPEDIFTLPIFSKPKILKYKLRGCFCKYVWSEYLCEELPTPQHLQYRGLYLRPSSLYSQWKGILMGDDSSDYFRCLCEDEKNHALELSITTSLSVENSLHCTHHKLNAMNPPLNAKTNYPEEQRLLPAFAPYQRHEIITTVKLKSCK